jgi:hypothetical protein
MHILGDSCALLSVLPSTSMRNFNIGKKSASAPAAALPPPHRRRAASPAPRPTPPPPPPAPPPPPPDDGPGVRVRQARASTRGAFVTRRSVWAHGRRCLFHEQCLLHDKRLLMQRACVVTCNCRPELSAEVEPVTVISYLRCFELGGGRRLRRLHRHPVQHTRAGAQRTHTQYSM